jgi:hypothetical protein
MHCLEPCFRHLLCWLALASLLAAQSQPSTTEPAMRLKIDHVTICAAELQPMQDAFARAGLKTEYGGPHASITHMAWLGFADGSYLELIAPRKRGDVGNSPWAKPMAGNAGPCAWAVASTDLPRDLAQLKRRGIQAGDPTPGGRNKPDGTMLRWETASVGPGPNGSLLPFMIEDKTPRSLRVQPSAGMQDRGLTGIAAVVIAVRDLKSAVELFRKAYGWPQPITEEHPEFAARLAHFAATPVVLASPLEKSSWLNQRLQTFGEGPAAFLLATSDPASVRIRFALNAARPWFGRPVAWFDDNRILGVRLAVIEK